MLKPISFASVAVALVLNSVPSYAKELKSIGISLGSLGNPFFVMARRAVQVGVDILNGHKPASAVELLPSKLVTRDDVAEYKGWTSDRSQ